MLVRYKEIQLFILLADFLLGSTSTPKVETPLFGFAKTKWHAPRPQESNRELATCCLRMEALHSAAS